MLYLVFTDRKLRPFCYRCVVGNMTYSYHFKFKNLILQTIYKAPHVLGRQKGSGLAEDDKKGEDQSLARGL